MKKEVKFLRQKAVNSLILSIELFNRPHDVGRTEGVLIFLDHSFEMLLKAAILHRGGRIREPRAKQTIGFDACVRRALSDSGLTFLTKEQAMTLQVINSLRDAAQHHLLDLSEQQLYLQSQAGLTLFRDIFKGVFCDELHVQLPSRVLPLSTSVPVDLASLFDYEVSEIRKLLHPGTRRRLEAATKIRSLEIVERAVQGERVQPGQSELRQLLKDVAKGKEWSEMFPGVASIELTTKGYGPSLDLRISKKEGVPITLVPEGTPGAGVVAVKRVDELGFYNLSRSQLAEHLGLTGPKTGALMNYLDLHGDSECFKEIVIGKAKFKRYSQKALTRLKEAREKVSIDDVWRTHGFGHSRKGVPA